MRLTGLLVSLALFTGTATADETPPPVSDARLRPQVEGRYATWFSLHDHKGKGRRATIATSFEGPVGLEAAHHRLRAAILDQSATNATSFLARGRMDLWEALSVAGALGYFSPGSDHVFGEAKAQYTFSLPLTMEGGFERTPLALIVPLARPDQDVMREAFFVNLAWEDWLAMRSAIKREGTFAPYEEHEVVGRVALFKGASPDDHLYVKFPVSMTLYPKASPFYRADPRVTRIGFGFDYARDMGAPWTIKAGTEYQLVSVMLRGRNGQARRMGRLQVSGEWATKRRKGWEFYVKGLYARAEEEEDFRLDDLTNYLAAGFRYST